MKYIFTSLVLLSAGISFAQPDFPSFLQGTWKMDNKEVYEHWDQLGSKKLKGVSYKINEGNVVVSEYLEITEEDNEIIYTATVPNQNNGVGVDFKLSKIDTTFTFENPDHDFPKKIVYQKLNETEVYIHVSDGKRKGFSYKMRKLHEKSAEKDTTVSNPKYDAALARRLGADEYEMKGYILVILKTGTTETTDKVLIRKSFQGHQENISRLVKKGKLIVAGPLGKNDRTYRGIFILNEESIEEAEQLLKTDPAIEAGLLDFELYNWYGSAALPEYLELSDKIWKMKP